MQEEVENKTLTLVVSGTKFTGRLLKAAISKYMAHLKEAKVEKRRKRETPVVHRGKQTVKQLTRQNQGVSNIDIQDKEIRQFERIARKYGVDYAVKKDRSTSPPKYMIFFKGRDADAITAAGDAMTALGISFTQVTRDTNIIAQVLAGESTVTSVFTADQLNTITEFGQHMDFFGIDLTRVPQYSLAADNLPLLIFPILAVVTMFISTHISMKASGQEMQGSMKLTMYMMPLMYVFFCFTVPCAFSLYYVISNIVMTVQTQIMRKIYDPEKMKEQVKAEIASRKKEEKRGVKSTTIKVQDEKTGEVVEKNISASEMNKRRLEYARQQDAERYKDERTVPLSELQNKKED